LLAADIFEGVDRSGVPEIGNVGFAAAAADPLQLQRIEAHARRLQQRRCRQAVERRADHGPVERAGGIQLVGHGQAGGAGWFCTITVGLPGICAGRKRAISRALMS